MRNTETVGVRRRAFALCGTLVVVGVVLLLTVLPTASAAGAFSLQFNAPYGGIGETSATRSHTGCHSYARFTTLPKANGGNGHLAFGITSGSGGCQNSSSAGIQSGVALAGPTFVANATGHPTVHVRMAVTWSFTISIISGSTPTVVQSDLTVGTVVFDNTTGTPTAVGSFYYTAFSNSTSSGNVSGHGSGIAHLTVAFAGSNFLLVGHTYFLLTGLSGEVYGSSSGTGRWSGALTVGAPTTVLGVSIF